MREIKFRAWDTVGKQWLLITGFETAETTVSDGYTLDGLFHDGDYVGKEGIILMQYTGMKDKNGKEIYEGDIIEFDKWLPNETFVRVIRGEVYWSDKGYWAVRNKDGKFLELLGRTENPEQIGNKYENPELLQEEWEERT